MSKYKLVNVNDGNDITELDAQTFQEAVEEALLNLQWYIIDEGDYFSGVNDQDSNDTIDLKEQTYEDAQYELIERLGYFISTNED